MPVSGCNRVADPLQVFPSERAAGLGSEAAAPGALPAAQATPARPRLPPPFGEGQEPPGPAGRPAPPPRLQGHLHNADLEQLLSPGQELFKVFGLRLNKGHRTALLGAAHP